MEYASEVIRRFEAPAFAGPLQADSRGCSITGTAGEIRLGTTVGFTGRIEAGRLAELRFAAYGCPHTIAAADRVAEQLTGRGVEALEAVDPHQLALELEVPANKLGRMLVIEDALHLCAQDWRRKGTERS